MSLITDAQNTAIEAAAGRMTQYLAALGDTFGTSIVETVVSGTPFQVHATRRSDVYIALTTAQTIKIELSADNSTFVTVMPSATGTIGLYTCPVPAGWYVKLTTTVANATVTAFVF